MIGVAFTIGNATSYDRDLMVGHRVVRKLGRSNDPTDPYEGGWVWRTYDDAQTFISNTELPFTAKVYGLILVGGWEKSVSPEVATDGVHRLLVDSVLFIPGLAEGICNACDTDLPNGPNTIPGSEGIGRLWVCPKCGHEERGGAAVGSGGVVFYDDALADYLDLTRDGAAPDRASLASRWCWPIEEVTRLVLDAERNRGGDPPRLGDHVHHGPSAEDWIVLYVDGDRLAWMGYPPGEADLADCTVITRCIDEVHQREIARLLSAKTIVSREYKALRIAGVTNPRSTWTAP